MKQWLIVMAVGAGLSSSALAGMVHLNPDAAAVAKTPDSTVAAMRYRVSNTNWDQMIATGSDVGYGTIVQNSNIGNHSALNGATWDFTVAYTPFGGFAFTLQRPGTSSTVSWAAPAFGLSPTRSYNALHLQVETGANMPGNIAAASVAVSDLAFVGTRMDSAGTLRPLSAAWSNSGPSEPAAPEAREQWIVATDDLAETSWTLTGKVTASFAYRPGFSQPGGNLDERLKFDVRALSANVIAVPEPGSVLLGLIALPLLGLGRRGLR